MTESEEILIAMRGEQITYCPTCQREAPFTAVSESHAGLFSTATLTCTVCSGVFIYGFSR